MYIVFAVVTALSAIAPEFLIALLTVNAFLAALFYGGQIVIALFPV